MTYRTLLYPWCIVRLLPQLQRVTVARCRRRSEAENHLKVLRRLMPAGVFVIVFDPPAPVPTLARSEPLTPLQPKQ
jgi:hypothetical protein